MIQRLLEDREAALLVAGDLERDCAQDLELDLVAHPSRRLRRRQQRVEMGHRLGAAVEGDQRTHSRQRYRKLAGPVRMGLVRLLLLEPGADGDVVALSEPEPRTQRVDLARVHHALHAWRQRLQGVEQRMGAGGVAFDLAEPGQRQVRRLHHPPVLHQLAAAPALLQEHDGVRSMVALVLHQPQADTEVPGDGEGRAAGVALRLQGRSEQLLRGLHASLAPQQLAQPPLGDQSRRTGCRPQTRTSSPGGAAARPARAGRARGRPARGSAGTRRARRCPTPGSGAGLPPRARSLASRSPRMKLK